MVSQAVHGCETRHLASTTPSSAPPTAPVSSGRDRAGGPQWGHRPCSFHRPSSAEIESRAHAQIEHHVKPDLSCFCRTSVRPSCRIKSGLSDRSRYYRPTRSAKLCLAESRIDRRPPRTRRTMAAGSRSVSLGMHRHGATEQGRRGQAVGQTEQRSENIQRRRAPRPERSATRPGRDLQSANKYGCGGVTRPSPACRFSRTSIHKVQYKEEELVVALGQKPRYSS
jgi:hypothetical protein